jgi:hypothetical protein
MSTIASIMEQPNSFEDINSIICEVCLGHHFTKYCSKMKQVSAWKKLCNEELMHGTESLNSSKGGVTHEGGCPRQR